MNADYIHDRCVVSPIGGQRTARRLLLIATALCLVVHVTTGCQSSNPHQTAAPTHYAQLEQVCFGYEPTVWRTMPGQCEQAVRLIPEETVRVPAATPAQNSTGSASPTETPPGQSILEGVPEPSGRLPAIMNLLPETTTPETPSTETPAPESTTPEGTVPSEVVPAETPTEMPNETPAPAQPPVEPAPLKESIPLTPGTSDSLEAAPVTPQSPPKTDEKLSRREAQKSVSSAARRPSELAASAANANGANGANSAAASELFRSIEQALVDNPSDTQVAQRRPVNNNNNDNSASGLARFISY
ncbi:MAG: hypothetical protein ACYC3X_26895 [Pirellulaceae bacterium]